MTTTSQAPLPEKRWRRAFSRDMALMLGAYGAVLVPSLLIADRTSGAIRYAVSAVPILPFATLGWIVVRSLRRVDERERILVYRAIAFAFFGTAVLTLGYGFMENAGAPRLSMFAVWPAMGALWILGGRVALRMP